MSEQLEAFLTRIPEFGPLVKAVVGDGLKMGMQVRESGKRVLVDLTATPIRVTFDPPSFSDAVVMRASRSDLEDLLAGRLDVMQGIGQRRLLVAGGMNDLVAVVPLFDLTPVLWAAAAAPARTGWLQRPVGWLARLAGQGLANLDREALLEGLRGLAKGASGQMPDVPASQAGPPRPLGFNPLSVPEPEGLRRLAGPAAREGLKLAGWTLAFARFRLGLPVDLIETVGSLAAGLDPHGE